MVALESECCGWDVWAELAGFGSVDGDRPGSKRVAGKRDRRLAGSAEASIGEQPVHDTRESDEDR